MSGRLSAAVAAIRDGIDAVRGRAVATDGGTTSAATETAAETPDDGGSGTTNPARALVARLADDPRVFWLPWVLVAGLFVYGAVGWNLLISLTDYEGFDSPDYSDLDLQMYLSPDDPARAGDVVGVIHSEAFVTATKNTVALMVAFTVVCLVLGLVLAVLLDRNIRFEDGFRNVYLLPMSLSFVVTAQFWLWMYNVDNGIVNRLLGVVGLGPYNWIGNPDLVLGAVVFALIWQFSGYTMVVYLAALRGIPDAHYEAAKVDGASTLRMYWRVIIPQLKNATISASVLLMVFALKAFDFLYSLVGGYRPPNGADILATLMVRRAFQETEWAYGSAVAIVLFAMTLVIIGPYLYHQYRQGVL